MAEVDGFIDIASRTDTMDFVRLGRCSRSHRWSNPWQIKDRRFRLIGTSGLDGVSIADFTLEVSAFRNATIDAVQSDVVVDPDGNTRVDVIVRNTGNTPDTFAITGQSRRQRSCIGGVDSSNHQ